jgi:hypothetical protein
MMNNRCQVMSGLSGFIHHLALVSPYRVLSHPTSSTLHDFAGRQRVQKLSAVKLGLNARV